jgi:decaprenylphospho-beta-D-ribofuranose 2-oxidase
MPRWAEKTLTGWGRTSRAACLAARPERVGELAEVLNDHGDDTLLAHGAGRSYGDVALNSGGRVVMTTRLDRLIELDTADDRLIAESGVSFGDAMNVSLAHGYMLPVVPGTGFATLGGGIANDVHGKNHHRAGSLGHHLIWFDLRLPNGQVRRVTPDGDTALFKATVGGIGLTGVIERLCIRLRRVPSNAVRVRKGRIRDLEHFLRAFDDEQDRAEYVVGWIDALAKGARLGRGIIEAGEPVASGVKVRTRKPIRVPLDFPAFAMSPLVVRAFNSVYRSRVPPGGTEYVLPYERFLFPLDALHDWNRIYGRRGFRQFQCVVPFNGGERALRAMLELISRSGSGSFLAVLKAMGQEGAGYLSFPKPGYTLALDFPNAPGAVDLIAQLEHIACEHGGRTYLAKDSTLSPERFRAMYPDLREYQRVLEDIDPEGRMNSDLARRLGLRESS